MGALFFGFDIGLIAGLALKNANLLGTMIAGTQGAKVAPSK
jgi:hypothetical protein